MRCARPRTNQRTNEPTNERERGRSKISRRKTYGNVVNLRQSVRPARRSKCSYVALTARSWRTIAGPSLGLCCHATRPSGQNSENDLSSALSFTRIGIISTLLGKNFIGDESVTSPRGENTREKMFFLNRSVDLRRRSTTPHRPALNSICPFDLHVVTCRIPRKR